MRGYLLHRDVAKKYRENVLMINIAELICWWMKVTKCQI